MITINRCLATTKTQEHDDVIKWKHFPRYWPFVLGIHRSPVNSQHKGLWRGALMFSLICVWINVWVNNGEAGDLKRYRAHCDVTVMKARTMYLIRGVFYINTLYINIDTSMPKRRNSSASALDLRLFALSHWYDVCLWHHNFQPMYSTMLI